MVKREVVWIMKPILMFVMGPKFLMDRYVQTYVTGGCEAAHRHTLFCTVCNRLDWVKLLNILTEMTNLILLSSFTSFINSKFWKNRSVWILCPKG